MPTLEAFTAQYLSWLPMQFTHSSSLLTQASEWLADYFKQLTSSTGITGIFKTTLFYSFWTWKMAYVSWPEHTNHSFLTQDNTYSLQRETIQTNNKYRCNTANGFFFLSFVPPKWVIKYSFISLLGKVTFHLDSTTFWFFLDCIPLHFVGQNSHNTFFLRNKNTSVVVPMSADGLYVLVSGGMVPTLLLTGELGGAGPVMVSV